MRMRESNSKVNALLDQNDENKKVLMMKTKEINE